MTLYAKLDPSRREIRLLHLSPGEPSDAIVCKLATGSLDHKLDYEALSYVWGDASIRKPIKVNGIEVGVTINLFTALKFLRHRSTYRLLWVDALCINQEDIPERESQVELMTAIYSNSHKVLGWIGDPNDDGIISTGEELVDALELIEKLNDGYSDEIELLDVCLQFSDCGLHNLRSRFSESDPSEVRNTLAAVAFLVFFYNSNFGNRNRSMEHLHPPKSPFFEEQDPRGSQHFKIASAFETGFGILARWVNAPWWDRIWTAQEACVASKLFLVVYHLYIPFDLLENAVYWNNMHALRCCEEPLSTLPESQIDVMHRLILKVHEIVNVRRNGRCERKPLTKLLNLYRSRQAKDPRDKINALLGLSEWTTAEAIKPTYSLSTEKTYVNAAMNLIKEHNSLDFIEADSADVTQLQVPSWVQDWSTPQSFSGLKKFEDRLPLYAAGGELSMADLCCETVLKVDGVDVDTIAGVGRVCEYTTTAEFVSVLKEWENMLVTHGHNLDQVYTNGKSKSDAFRSTLCADLVRQTKTLTRGLGARPHEFYRCGDYSGGRRYARWNEEGDEELCRNWWKVVEVEFRAANGEAVDEELTYNWYTHIRNVVFDTVQHRCFFITNKGYLGLGPSATKVGDQVFVLRGGILPFVLRKDSRPKYTREDCNHPHELCYKLVGTCYVHGIMDGEALKEEKMEVHLC